MPFVEAHNHLKYLSVDDMVHIVSKITSQNVGRSSNPILVAAFGNSDEEVQFICLLHRKFSEDTGISFLILQDCEIPVLFGGEQCRFVSSSNIVQVIRLIGHFSQPEDILVLRRPTDPFVVTYFTTYLTACARIGLRLVGLITFVGDNFDKEIIL